MLIGRKWAFSEVEFVCPQGEPWLRGEVKFGVLENPVAAERRCAVGMTGLVQITACSAGRACRIIT